MDLTQCSYVDIRQLTNQDLNKPIQIRGRVHKIRVTGNIGFIILRYQNHSLQIIATKKQLGPDVIKQLSHLTLESVIDCYGLIRESPTKIEATSYHDFEMDLFAYNVVSLAKPLPFQIDDANDAGSSFRSTVNNQLQLDCRWLSLRTPVNNSVFRIQSATTQYFREWLNKNKFIEIHSPKLIGAASEGGSQAFQLQYFDRPAFLAQSPQLYKQMAINADFDRVFEVGPVFRAENSLTSRHMCEFVGLDLEMTITPGKTYREIQEMLWSTLTYIFDNIKTYCQQEVNIVKEKLEFLDPVYPHDPLIIAFSDCVQMLREAGFSQDDFEDLNTENEKKVGELVKQKYGSDLFIIDQYPSAVRPFYTMANPNNKNYSNSFDVIFRCTEISSGSQREHDYDILMHKVLEKNINPESLKYYLDSFSHGSRPHGGCGFGLERIVALYLGLGNVKLASMCPRDPERLFP